MLSVDGWGARRGSGEKNIEPMAAPLPTLPLKAGGTCYFRFR
jgi:hypothetical protein